MFRWYFKLSRIKHVLGAIWELQFENQPKEIAPRPRKIFILSCLILWAWKKILVDNQHKHTRTHTQINWRALRPLLAYRNDCKSPLEHFFGTRNKHSKDIHTHTHSNVQVFTSFEQVKQKAEDVYIQKGLKENQTKQRIHIHTLKKRTM